MRVTLCDWCSRPANETREVKFSGEEPLDCCLACLKGVRPKPKIGRPRKAKVVATEPAVKGQFEPKSPVPIADKTNQPTGD